MRWRWLAGLGLLATLSVASPVSAAGIDDPLVAPLLDYGEAPAAPRLSLLDPSSRPLFTDPMASPLFGGPWLAGVVDVSPLRLLEPGTTISFDLRLGWPSVTDTVSRGPVQPYLTFGPALFITEPRDLASPLPPRGDTSAMLGLKAGAGVTWRIERDAALFGEYRVTRGGVNALAPLGGAAADVGGFDVLYGVRVRF